MQFEIHGKSLNVILPQKSCEACKGKGKQVCYCGVARGFLAHQYESQYHPTLSDHANDLHNVKCELNVIDLHQWSKHTEMQFIGGRLKSKIRQVLSTQPEMLTNAWLKLWEILSTHEAIWRPETRDHLKSFHLGECPGAFVTCLNHFLKSKVNCNMFWQWWANTLDPWHEHNDWHSMLDATHFLKCTYGHWMKGADGTGNLTKPQNLSSIIEDSSIPKMDLITADGSFNTQHDAAQQEELLFPLLLAEILIAWAKLKESGTFILKMYGPTTHSAIGLLALLKQSFDKVVLHKPVMSKPGNSEVYAVCIGYVGISSTIFSRLRKLVDVDHKPGRSLLRNEREIAPECLKSIETASMQLIQKQKDTIQDNLNTFRHSLQSVSLRMKEQFALDFLLKYNICELQESYRVVPAVDLNSLTSEAKKQDVPAQELERNAAYNEWQQLQQERANPFMQSPVGIVLRLSTTASIGVKDKEEFSDMFSKSGGHILSLDWNAGHSSTDGMAQNVLRLLKDPTAQTKENLGRWPSINNILKPFRITSSPYYTPSTFQKLIHLRSLCPAKLPPIHFSDISDMKMKQGGREADLVAPAAYDIALVCLAKFRQKINHPVWMEISQGEFGMMSLPLRITKCEDGVLIDIGGNGKPVKGAEDVKMIHCPGLQDWEGLKDQMANKPPCNILLIGLSQTFHKELVQDEINDQKFLLRSLRAGLKFLAPEGDLILELPTCATRFTGSLILLLSLMFNDISIIRPPTTPAWTQRRYLYCRRYLSKERADQVQFSVGLINSAVMEYNTNKSLRDPKVPRSIHYLLPPYFFADENFSKFLTLINEKMAENEICSYNRIISQLISNQEYITSLARRDATESNLDTQSEEQWYLAYKTALFNKHNQMLESINRLFCFKGLFIDRSYTGFGQWIAAASQNASSDLKDLSKLPLESVGFTAIYTDLKEYLEKTEVHETAIAREPEAVKWGWQNLDRLRLAQLVPKYYPSCSDVSSIVMGPARVSVAEEYGTFAELLHSFINVDLLPTLKAIESPHVAMTSDTKAPCAVSAKMANATVDHTATSTYVRQRSSEDGADIEFSELMPTDEMFDEDLIFDG